MTESAIVGSLLGTAVGDAIGLPYEGLSRRRSAQLLGEPDRHRLVLGRGMVSDDTEHSCMVLQALIACRGDPDRFAENFSQGLRWWILGVPAGVGFATLKAALKLWTGFLPRHSGVFSAGNGPAMRSAVLGAAVDDVQCLQRFVRESTRITHRDPKAEYGAMAVALAAHLASRGAVVSGSEFLVELSQVVESGAGEFVTLAGKAVESADRDETTPAFAASLGLERGVSGYVYHTVPVALHAWLSNQHDYRTAVSEVVRCGGDTDTTAAIVGGIVGAAVGKSGIPADWLDGLWEWPRTTAWMERLAGQLSAESRTEKAAPPLRLPVYGVIPRNLVFLGIVLAHGFRRLFPPY
ncbi:MAG: ADP-ribosylglycohydrolase family protein [Planctomycetia bacterium]|nr:ADP-ribosylglycohydrolase family protein [Planctomycetia bacterium]